MCGIGDSLETISGKLSAVFSHCAWHFAGGWRQGLRQEKGNRGTRIVKQDIKLMIRIQYHFTLKEHTHKFLEMGVFQDDWVVIQQ